MDKENTAVESEGDEKSRKGKDFVEFNFGKCLGKIRENPWMVSSIVLGLLFLGALIFGVNGGTNNVVSEKEVSDNVMNFLSSNVQGDVSLSSVDLKDGYYEVLVSYQGQDVPIYATLDGKNLIASLIPLDGSAKSSNVDVQNQNPNTPVNVDVPKDAYSKGSVNAPVTIVEFSDFQCPFCEKFYSDTLSQIENTYVKTGKVRFVYMNFPLGFHENAESAAEAAECAGEQGKFWEMHDKLFDNQESLGIDNYKSWARDISLDSTKFNNCLDSNKYKDKINSELTYGQSLGVSGTPAFFVNGVKLEGAQPFSAFEQIIDKELVK